MVYCSPAKIISSPLGAVSPASSSLLFWDTLLLFYERNSRSSDVHTSRHGALLPPVISLDVGVGGPPHSRSVCPRSEPCNFRAWLVVRITTWGPFPLGGRWPFGLLISRFLDTASILARCGSGPSPLVTVVYPTWMAFLHCSISSGPSFCTNSPMAIHLSPGM